MPSGAKAVDTFGRITVTIEMEPRPEGLAELFGAINELGGHAGWPRRFLEQAQLVLEEIAMNVVMHSGHKGGIPITMTASGRRAEFSVRDRGMPFDPNRDSPPPPKASSFDDIPIGGLGLPLVRSIVDRMEYRREDDVNCLRLLLSVPRETASVHPQAPSCPSAHNNGAGVSPHVADAS